MYVDSYTSNGVESTVVVDDASHAVMDGDWGAVSDFDYVADPDVCTTVGTDETVLMVIDGTTDPVVWAADDGSQRTVVMNVGVYNSHDCPISDESGLESIGVLLQNAVWWAGGW